MIMITIWDIHEKFREIVLPSSPRKTSLKRDPLKMDSGS